LSGVSTIRFHFNEVKVDSEGYGVLGTREIWFDEVEGSVGK